MAITLRSVAQMSGKRCKKSLFLIPYCFTFANAFFGFISVIEALQGNLVKAACYIGLAACADALDGRLARAFGSSSYLGAELDGLCDAISFCFAPTILIYSLFQENIPSVGVGILGLYLCAGLFRLAKFNVTQSSSKAYFSGLSTPVSAFFLATLVLYYDWFAQSCLWFCVEVHGIMFVVSILSILMISTIPFYSFKGTCYSHSLVYLIAAYGSLLIIASLQWGIPILFLLLAAYIGFSIVAWLIVPGKIGKKIKKMG